MYYEVGTCIDLRHINKPKPEAEKTALFQPAEKERLVLPGTKFLFVKNLSLPPQIIIPAM